MTPQKGKHCHLWFRADRLLECCFSYEEVSWVRLGGWAKSNRLWTYENGDEPDPHPIPVHSRWRVLNVALKILESLGHIDVNWQNCVVARPVSWVRTCWEPDRGTPPEWVLSGARCEDMIRHLSTEVNLLIEPLLHVDFKDMDIRRIQSENRFNLSVRLPDRICSKGDAAPDKPNGCVSLGSPDYPGSWELALSVSRVDELHDRAIGGNKYEWIDNNRISHLRWLHPRANIFSVGKPPDEFYSHKLCLTQRVLDQSGGYAGSYEAIMLDPGNGNGRPGLTRVSKLELNREERNWLSYYLLHKDVRTLKFNSTENTLSHPSSMDLPTIVGRILAICSGRPPVTQFYQKKPYICYSNVSSVLALKVAKKLNVELFCA